MASPMASPNPISGHHMVLPAPVGVTQGTQHCRGLAASSPQVLTLNWLRITSKDPKPQFISPSPLNDPVLQSRRLEFKELKGSAQGFRIQAGP